MVRSFFTFLSGFFFVLVAVPIVFLVGIFSFFNDGFRDESLLEGLHDVAVDYGTSLIGEIDPQLNATLSHGELGAIVRSVYGLKFFSAVMDDFAEQFHGSATVFNLSLQPVLDLAPVLASRIAESYYQRLGDCEDDFVDFGTNLPNCLNDEFGFEDVERKVDLKIEGAVSKMIPPSISLGSGADDVDHSFYFTFFSDQVRLLTLGTLSMLAFFFLVIMAYTRRFSLRQVIVSMGVVFMLAGAMTVFLGGAVNWFLGKYLVVSESGEDYFLRVVKLVVESVVGDIRYDALLLVFFGVVVGGIGFFSPKWQKWLE